MCVYLNVPEHTHKNRMRMVAVRLIYHLQLLLGPTTITSVSCVTTTTTTNYYYYYYYRLLLLLLLLLLPLTTTTTTTIFLSAFLHRRG